MGCNPGYATPGCRSRTAEAHQKQALFWGCVSDSWQAQVLRPPQKVYSYTQIVRSEAVATIVLPMLICLRFCCDVSGLLNLGVVLANCVLGITAVLSCHVTMWTTSKQLR